ncbi:MFS transporter [Anaerovorax odorimutans]|uniref:MFS transporter n=1 Tax=Anaerovorax odorimutans TaxID=109327 RepID=A0ABT1RQB6_9FIRM|nr:MFS transporter [Anaerovorax odorimutans]MCQ4637387.1 MFS transporter [Anaerovorax odorimutans]
MNETNHLKWKKKFFTIAIGQTVSLIGSSAVQFAMIWWMAIETDSPIMMSLAGLVAFLPQLILGPFAGVWIDRRKRKTVVIAADMFVGLVAAAFAIAFVIGRPPVWSVCLVLGIRAIGGVFHTPAIQALIPMLVPSQELMKANGWSQFMQSGAFMLGPVFGAFLFGAFSMPVILLTDLLGAMAACITVAVIKIREPEKSGTEYPNFRREFKEGIAVFRADPRLLHLLINAAVCMVFFLPLASLYPLMSSSYFKVNAFHAGIVEFLYAAGMMVSALVIGQLFQKTNRLRLARMGLLLLGIIILACGILPADYVFFWIFAGLCLLMGACGNVYGLPVMTYMQETVAPESLGRAFSLLGSVMSLAMPLGLLIAGPCAEKLGVAFWFLASGIAMVLVTAGMALYDKKAG